jgi:hypothetical protein
MLFGEPRPAAAAIPSHSLHARLTLMVKGLVYIRGSSNVISSYCPYLK